MGEKAKNISSISSVGSRRDSSDQPIESIKGRRSKELVIGLCGTIGSGISNLDTVLQEQLIDHGYRIENISLSDLITAASTQLPPVSKISSPLDTPAPTLPQPNFLVQSSLEAAPSVSKLERNPPAQKIKEFERIQKLQDMGDALRLKFGASVVAELAIEEITVRREASKSKTDQLDKNLELAVDKVAYILNQLKHPKEIEILKVST